MRAAIVGIVLVLGACVSAPSGPHGSGNGATVSGSVTSSQGGAISGATVTITPSGASALAAVQTSSSGSYTVNNVPTGDGDVVVSNLPSNCSATVDVAYTGLKNGGSRTLNIIAGCSSSTTLP